MSKATPNDFPEMLENANHSYLGKVVSVGPFNGFRPSGITLHYTADRDIARVVKTLKDRGLGYNVIIDRDGTIYQTAKLTDRCYHAGKAIWNGKSPNRTHLSISLISWGFVKEAGPHYEAWNREMVPAWDVKDRFGQYWDAATEAQERSMLQLLVLLVGLGIDPGEICGHDECALPPGRKADPGGVIGVRPKNLRDQIKAITSRTSLS